MRQRRGRLASPSAAGPARIPETSGHPEALASGTYLTPEGFAPELSVELPRGWWGGGGTGGWVVGKGNDPARQAFTGPSLWVDVVTMPWRDAVTALGKVDRVRYSAPPERSTLDGHRTMTFHATPQGREPVLLDEALSLGVDLPPASDRQLLVEAGDVTLLFRIENDAPAMADVLGSRAFS